MQFTYDNQLHIIDFVYSENRTTTARVRREQVGIPRKLWPSIIEATVRCWSGDAYCREDGRRAALRKLTTPLAVAHHPMGGLIMQAYHTRPRPKDPNSIFEQIKRLKAELPTELRSKVELHT
jgi:hypothetical protein